MTLKLYHGEPASNSLKGLIPLKEKGLAFESVYLDMFQFEQHQPAFIAINPDGQVPVLDHDGFILNQSTVIMEYLEDAFPESPPLRPADPKTRARMRQWNKFIDDHVWSYFSLHGFHNHMGPMLRARFDEAGFEAVVARVPLYEMREKWRSAWRGFSEAELANATRKVEIAVDRADAQFARTPWLTGDMFTLADINLFADCGWALNTLFPQIGTPERCPHLLDWIARMRARPGVQAALAMSRMGAAPPPAAAEAAQEAG